MVQCSWTVACKIGVAAWVVHTQQAGDQHAVADSWTCKRVADNTLTQLGFIPGGLQFEHEKSWHDNCLGTGLDHRCAHRICRI